jgi:hypothetical protein
MPMIRSLYPSDWEDIAAAIKDEADWTCEECGKPCRRPKVSWEEFVDWLLTHPNWEIWHPQTSEPAFNYETGSWCEVPHSQRFTLTVAHLNHRPADCSRSNLRAWCVPCHARYDLGQIKLKQWIKAEREGQGNLFSDPELAGQGLDPSRVQLSLLEQKT